MGIGEFFVARKNFKKFFSFIILFFVLLVAVFLFLHSSFFNIDKIYAVGNKQLTEEEITKFSGVTIGQNIFAVDNSITAKMIEVHPLVKDAEVYRHLPRTIEIKVIERQIWAVVPSNNEFICIDDEGIIIDRKITMDLSIYPLITFAKQPDNVNIGQTLQPKGVQLIKTIWEILDNNSKDYISDFHYNDKDELIIYTRLGTEIRFGNEDRLEEKAGFFSDVIKIEQDFNREGKELLEYIDLRFKGQPVVKTKT